MAYRKGTSKRLAEGKKEKLQLLRGKLSRLGDHVHHAEVIRVTSCGVHVGEVGERRELRPASGCAQGEDPAVENQRTPGVERVSEKMRELGDGRNAERTGRGSGSRLA